MLRCNQPVPGMVYLIRWTYKEDEEDRKAETAEDWVTRVRVQEATHRLLELARQTAAGDAGASPQYTKIRETLEILEMRLKSILSARDERLDISLMAMDEAEQVLRLVGTNSDDISQVYQPTLHPGEGCGGWVFEKGRPLLYHSADPESVGLYIRPEELEADGVRSLLAYECLLSLPWRYQERFIVGVIDVGSRRVDSALLNFFVLADEAKRATMDRIHGLTLEAANGILDVLGGEGHAGGLEPEGE